MDHAPASGPRGLAALVLAAAPDGVLAFDRDCRYTAWNEAMERLSGVPAAAALGRVAFALFPFLVETEEDRCFHEALAGRTASSSDRPFVVPATGHEGFYEARYAPLRDAAGAVVGGVGVIRDVTARVRAARETAEAKQRAERTLRLHTLVLERMTEGVSVTDERGFIVYTNPAEDRMFGYAPGELIGKHVTVQNTYPPEENARMVGEVIARLRTSGHWEGHWNNVRRDGTRFVTHARITALELDGTPHWVCVQEDVTERRRAAQRVAFLARASSVLAETLDVEATLAAVARLAVPDLADWCFVELLDAAGVPRPSAVHHQDPGKVALGWDVMTRYPVRPEDAYGSMRVARSGEPALVPEVREAALAGLAHDAEHLRVLREVGFRSTVQVPLRARVAAGGAARERVVGVLTFATTDASGRRYDAADLAVAEEVAARAGVALENARLLEAERAARAEAEAARAEAEAANRAKSQFLATMSHELRTPLNAIGGYVQLIEMGIRGPVTDEQREDLRRVRRSQQHLLGLINDVLNFARVDAGRVQFEYAYVSTAETLAAVEALVAPQAAERGHRLEVAPCDPTLTVWADPERTAQILVNLLTNAIKYTPPGGDVRVACAADEDARGRPVARIAVRDTGVGIAPEKLDVIFDPFVQVGRGLNRPGEGVGLGLAISRDLARQMGGDLTAESALGVGSAFTLTLPREPDERGGG